MAKCAVCRTELPATRTPTSNRQATWGGWTCTHCETDLDRHAQPLNTRVVRPDSVTFRLGPVPVRTVGTWLAPALGWLFFAILGSFGAGAAATMSIKAGITLLGIGTLGAFLLTILLISRAFRPSRMLQVYAHWVELDERRVPYTEIEELAHDGYALRIRTSEELLEVPATPEVHETLAGSLHRFRSGQSMASPADEKTRDALERLRQSG